MTRPTKLTDDEVSELLKAAEGWGVVDGEVSKTFVFKDFLHAMDFVTRLAGAAEEMQHHPDLDIRYNKVKVALSTHDVGGITQLDFTLVGIADQAARAVKSG